jgi:LysM repeat protein
VRFTPTRPNTPAASTLIAEPVTDVTPATTYTVVSGDSLWSISKKVHASTTEIAAANNLKTNAVLKSGQKLLIPGKAASASVAAAANPAASAGKSALTVAPTPKPSAEALRHVVKSGETLSTIAKQYGVKQSDIAMANNITDPAKIRAGMEIIIPGWQTPVSKSGRKSDTGAKSGTKSTTPPTISIGEPEPAPASKPPTSDVPVIQIDEGPVTPAPKK